MTEVKIPEELSEHSLAYELLVELKHSARRWFIAFCIMVVLEVTTIIGFMWYITLPVEEYTSYEQEVDDIDNSDNLRQLIITEGDYNGSETEGN